MNQNSPNSPNCATVIGKPGCFERDFPERSRIFARREILSHGRAFNKRPPSVQDARAGFGSTSKYRHPLSRFFPHAPARCTQVPTARRTIWMNRCRFVFCTERLFNRLTIVTTLCSRRGVFSAGVLPEARLSSSSGFFRRPGNLLLIP